MKTAPPPRRGLKEWDTDRRSTPNMESKVFQKPRATRPAVTQPVEGRSGLSNQVAKPNTLVCDYFNTKLETLASPLMVQLIRAR